LSPLPQSMVCPNDPAPIALQPRRPRPPAPPLPRRVAGRGVRRRGHPAGLRPPPPPTGWARAVLRRGWVVVEHAAGGRLPWEIQWHQAINSSSIIQKVRSPFRFSHRGLRRCIPPPQRPTEPRGRDLRVRRGGGDRGCIGPSGGLRHRPRRRAPPGHPPPWPLPPFTAGRGGGVFLWRRGSRTSQRLSLSDFAARSRSTCNPWGITRGPRSGGALGPSPAGRRCFISPRPGPGARAPPLLPPHPSQERWMGPLLKAYPRGLPPSMPDVDVAVSPTRCGPQAGP